MTRIHLRYDRELNFTSTESSRIFSHSGFFFIVVSRLQMFVHNFERMSLKQRRVMLKNFLLPFLSKPQSGLSWIDQSQSCFHIRFIIQSKYLLFISSNSRSRLRERIQFQYRVVDEEPRPVLHHVVPGTTAGPQPTL